MNNSRRQRRPLKILRSKKKILVFICGISVFGVLTILVAKAATFSISIEPEQGSGNVAPVSDATASGNSAIRFGSAVVSGNKCTLGLHGAGGGGSSYGPTDGVLSLGPQARNPATGSDTNKWLYDGPDNYQYDPTSAEDNQYYQYLVNYLRQTLDNRGCGPTIIAGSSSGGGFAAKMYCKGENFGGRVWAYLIDDPVMDEGVLNCQPSASTRIAFFTHTQEFDDVTRNLGSNLACDARVSYWYCENNRTMSLATYQQRTGQQSLLIGRYHWGDANNWYHWKRHADGSFAGHRYEALPWHFPAELWRTCYDQGNCSRQTFLP